MKAKRWVIDIDGCLCNFPDAVTKVLAELRPDQEAALWAALPPDRWSWYDHLITKADEKAAFKRVADDPMFWLRDCKPYPDATASLAAIDGLITSGDLVLFVTQRPANALTVTRQWLTTWGMTHPPTVVMIDDGKPEVIEALRTDVCIDDKPSTLTALAGLPAVRSYCCCRSWNLPQQEVWPEALKVNGVLEMIQREEGIR